MVIIIRALTHVRKKKSPKSTKTKKEKKEKKRGLRAQIKKREKKREGTMLLSFSTLVLHNSTMFFMIESFLFCHHHILVGIFII